MKPTCKPAPAITGDKVGGLFQLSLKVEIAKCETLCKAHQDPTVFYGCKHEELVVNIAAWVDAARGSFLRPKEASND